MTEQNNQWKIRLRQLHDLTISLVAKAKQGLLSFWRDLPIKSHKLKSATILLYRSSKIKIISTWHKLKLFWQGKSANVLKRPGKQEESGDADDDDVVMTDSERYLQTQSNVHSLTKIPRRRKKIRPIRRRGRQRVYRLKGYTTVAKVNRKHNAELQQQLLRKLLLFVGVILLLITLFYMYNPVRDLSELYRIIGISDIADLTVDNPLFPDISPTPEP